MKTIVPKHPSQSKTTSKSSGNGGEPTSQALPAKAMPAETAPSKPTRTGSGGEPSRPPDLAQAAPGDSHQQGGAGKVEKAGSLTGTGKGFAVENIDGQAMYLVSEYHGDGIKEFVVTESEAAHLDPNDVDCHIDEVQGSIQIKTYGGRLLVYEGSIRGLGPVGRALLDEIMRAPGRLLTAIYLAKNPHLTRIVEDWPRNALTLRLRRALGDTVEKSWYIFVATRPWRIRWQRERTWRVIEPMAE